MTDTGKNKRLFFALWPDDEVRAEITKAFNLSVFSKHTGWHFQPHNLHLTLHFLGNVSTEKMNCVMDIAEQLEFNSFELKLNQFDVFQKAKILYLGMMGIPLELLHLQSELGGLLESCHYQPERRVFTPHVTLKRKVSRFEINEQLNEISWRVTQFALVESVSGEKSVIYQPLKYFHCRC